jgi:hypothetical protein
MQKQDTSFVDVLSTTASNGFANVPGPNKVPIWFAGACHLSTSFSSAA